MTSASPLSAGNKRIVLISPYEQDSFSICVFHSLLSREGFDVSTVVFKTRNLYSSMDRAKREEIESLADFVAHIEPFLVGVTVKTTFFNMCEELAKSIKRRIRTTIVFGGIHPTVMPEESIRSCDAICVGEGEDAIVELASRLYHGKPIDDIANMWIKDDLSIKRNSQRPLRQNLDELPFPEFSGKGFYFLDSSGARQVDLTSSRTNYSVMTSRGCPYSCTYCSNYILRKIYNGTYVRRRSAENVIKELTHAKLIFKNLKQIIFDDDVFTFDTGWLKKFQNEYKEKIGLPFLCYTRSETISEEKVSILKDMGVAGITMGVQSGSEKFRHEAYERHDSNKQILQAEHLIAAHGIQAHYDVILDNPIEPFSSKMETFELLLQFKRPFELHVHSMTYFPKTKFTESLLSSGIISEKDIETNKGNVYKSYSPSLDLYRKKEDMFFDALFYMAKASWINSGLARKVSRSSFWKEHPRLLIIALKCTSFSKASVNYGNKIDELRYHILTWLKGIAVLLVRRGRIKKQQ